MKRRANSGLGDRDCWRMDCCHNCAFYMRGACVNDVETFGFIPRYLVRTTRAWPLRDARGQRRLGPPGTRHRPFVRLGSGQSLCPQS